jgi:GLPGLI family protein
MNKLILIALLFIISSLNAQNFQGKAIYQTKRNVDLKMDSTQVDDAQQKMIQEMLRKQFEKTYVLTFDKNASVYKEDEQLDKPKPNQGGIVIQVVGSTNKLYKNIKEKTYVDAQEMFGKIFLIKDELKTLDWKIEKDTKMIGKYLCFKATAIKMVDDFDDNTMEKKDIQKEMKIIAWYTPEIPIAHGPASFYGLPGLILELHEDRMHYVCTKIVLNPKDKFEVTAPKKGKVVTQNQFNDIEEKKSKEMMKNFKSSRKKGDGNTFSIQIGG